MKPKLIIAVSASATSAAAVIYDVKVVEPTFTFQDRTGAKVAKRFFYTEEEVPAYLSHAVERYVKNSALSWATVRMSTISRAYAMGLASARALERLRHTNPEALDFMNFGDVQIFLSGSEKLPQDLVHNTPQHFEAQDWRVHVATFLAKQGEIKNAGAAASTL